MNVADTPLKGRPPAEVSLTDPPLVRVIAQVRFPLIASVEKREFIAPFQEAIRKHYPALRPDQTRGVVLEPPGAVNARSSTVWRFLDAGGAWCVTLGPDYLALETAKYTSRDDFLERLAVVLQALQEHVNPRFVDRIGVRYIDRVVGENLNSLPQLVRSEVAGVLGTSLAAHVRHAISQTVFVLPDDSGLVNARWGLVPAHGTVDPGAVEAIDEISWLLDIDAFQLETCTLDVGAIVEQARRFAERIYSIFRWAVTKEFLLRYGGDP